MGLLKARSSHHNRSHDPCQHSYRLPVLRAQQVLQCLQYEGVPGDGHGVDRLGRPNHIASGIEGAYASSHGT